MALNVQSLLKVVLPNRANPKGTALTSTFNPSNSDNILSLPDYRDHLQDIFETRQASDSRELMRRLFVHDPDVSAAVNAFLTVANTDPIFICKDLDDVIDRDAQKDLNILLKALTTRFDYKTGFELKPSLRAISENMRYMVLLRGAVSAELILNKQKLPYQIRLVDTSTLEWFEREPNNFKPQQNPTSSNDPVSLDISTFFISFFRRDPTSIYSNSPFVSSINTVAARQQVINDLYRIMRFTGYPRIEVTILEDVLMKNVPSDIAADAQKKSRWVADQIASLTSQLSDLRPEQAFVHTDSMEATILNDKNPSAGINVDSIVSALNAQNQAALRTMSTILGRGESGVNTASVEARLFTMTAEEINEPVGELWSQMLTMAIRILGHEDITVECRFAPAEMRSALELEAQMAARQSRLRQDLSDGIITDDEYHLEMYGRIRPDSAPELSGTGFLTPVSSDVPGEQPNAIEKQAKPEGGQPPGSAQKGKPQKSSK
tara:strand:+ start:709 stop:2181 length:1473 start_codon:yes stop_codon:yes gene_type:complete